VPTLFSLANNIEVNNMAGESSLCGKQFASYGELQQWLETFQNENFVQFYVRDSRTIAAAQKHLPKRQLKTTLKYYQLTFACVQGGQKYKSKCSGVRPNQQ